MKVRDHQSTYTLAFRTKIVFTLSADGLTFLVVIR